MAGHQSKGAITMRMSLQSTAFASAVLLLVAPACAFAQEATSCRFICELGWKVEPTFTIENLARRHRIVTPDGATERVSREPVFETVLALDMKTKVPRLGFAVEAI